MIYTELISFISEYVIVLNEVLRRAVEESASIIVIQQQQQKQLLLQKKQENKNKLLNITGFRKQSQSYAQKLFGTPPIVSNVNNMPNKPLPPPHLPPRYVLMFLVTILEVTTLKVFFQCVTSKCTIVIFIGFICFI